MLGDKSLIQLLRFGLSRVPNFYFYLVATTTFSVIYLFPSRIQPMISQPYSTSVNAGIALPEPINYASSNLLPALTNRLFDVSNERPPTFSFGIFLVFLHLLIYFFIFCGFARLKGEFRKGYTSLILIFLPMHQLLMKPLDFYDVYIYLGIAICFYSIKSHEKLFLVGAGIFIFAHPEQALASFSALLILTFTCNFQFLRARVIRAVGFSILVNVAVQIWYLIFNFRGSRTVEIIFSFPNTLREHMSNITGSIEVILQMYGLLWILIFIALIKIPKNSLERFASVSSLVLAPLFFWFITSDGLRCVVPMTSLLSLVLINSLDTAKESFSRLIFRPSA